MRRALLIAGKDLRLRLRDRSVLVLGFVAPLAIATVMSFAFSGTDDLSLQVVVVDADGGQLGAAVVDVLGSEDLADLLDVEVVADRDAATRAVDDGDADAGLVIPPGFTDAVAGGEAPSLEVLAAVDGPIAADVVASIATSFAAQLDADRLSVATALAAGAPTDDLDRLVEEAAQEQLPVALAEQPTDSRPLDPISYYAPAMGIFFLFFAIGFTAKGWFEEAAAGTLERTATAASVGEIVAGKALSVFVYGLASLGTVAVVTSLAFGAEWGGVLPAGALVLAMVTSVVCLTALVVVVAHTDRQAEGLSSILVFGLSLLGGNFILIAGAPPLVRKLALLTPNGWALRGFVDLATGPSSLSVVAVPIAAIGAFSAVVLGVTVVLARRADLP